MTRAPCLPVLCLLMMGALPAVADPAVRPCDQRDTVDVLAEPWEAMSDTLANGAVRVAVIDRGEPAAAAIELLVLTPPVDEAGFRTCRIVSAGPHGGFAAIDFAERGAAYDAGRGLLLDMPVRIPDLAGGQPQPAQLSLTIRQDRGDVTARLLR